MSVCVFANNAETTLASTAAVSATSLVCTDSSVFPVPGTNEVVYLTLTDGGDPETVEVVKVTANTTGTNTLTISPGLSAEWAADSVIELRIPNDALQYFTQSDPDGDALGDYALSIQPYRFGSDEVASGDNSTAVGSTSKASGMQSASFGWAATCTKNLGCAIGPNSEATGGTVGPVALGSYCVASGTNSVAVGYNTTASARNIALGRGLTNAVDYSFLVGGLPIIRKSFSHSLDSKLQAFGGAEAVYISEAISLTQTAADNLVNLTMPTGARFFPSEVGIIVTAASAVTVQPEISFGISGNTTAILAQTATTASAQHGRDIWRTLVSYDGQATLTASLKVSATATTYTARFVYRGLFVETT